MLELESSLRGAERLVASLQAGASAESVRWAVRREACWVEGLVGRFGA